MTVRAIAYELEHQPGFVTFEFHDADGRRWCISEKLPVVGLPYPDDDSNVPFDFELPSRVVNSWTNPDGRQLHTIEFLYDIEANDGTRQFKIFRNQ